MRVYVNEECVELEEGTTLSMVRRRHFPGADLVVVNGHPAEEGRLLAEGDRAVFIRRGEVPPRERLEAMMAARHSPEVFARMKAATVGVAGLGGLGSAVSAALARMGVGRLILADGDVVEPSNLNRQFYFTDQIGMKKTEALKATLARINPFCGVEAHDVWLDAASAPRVFGQAGIVVEAFDRAEAKAMLIDALLKGLPRVTVVAASGLAGYDGGNAIRTFRAAERLYVVGDLVTEAGPGRGLMAPRVGIAAHHQANAVVRLLMGEDPAA